jgi:hypothetical protein
MNCCTWPSSPTARRASTIAWPSWVSETFGRPHTAVMSSSLPTARSRFSIRNTRQSNARGDSATGMLARRSSRASVFSEQSPNR